MCVCVCDVIYYPYPTVFFLATVVSFRIRRVKFPNPILGLRITLFTRLEPTRALSLSLSPSRRGPAFISIAELLEFSRIFLTISQHSSNGHCMFISCSLFSSASSHIITSGHGVISFIQWNRRQRDSTITNCTNRIYWLWVGRSNYKGGFIWMPLELIRVSYTFFFWNKKLPIYIYINIIKLWYTQIYINKQIGESSVYIYSFVVYIYLYVYIYIYIYTGHWRSG